MPALFDKPITPVGFVFLVPHLVLILAKKMAKRFTLEFKQQAIDYALADSHESLSVIVQKLGIGYSTLDEWICNANSTSSSKRQLSPEQQQIVELEKKVKQLKDVNEILKKAHVYFLTDHAKRSTI